MPTDHKRINGPENSTPYRLNSKINFKTHDEKLSSLFKKGGKRQDERKCDQHRKIYIKTGVVSQAKGSAYIEIDQTKVIVSVFDPREIPHKNEYSVQGQLYCEFKFAPFSCIRRKQHQPDQEERALGSALCRALQPAVCRHEFPNFQVDVFAYVLQNDGSTLSAAITCAGLALADAGIPMYDLITAATIGVTGSHIIIDPTAAEEEVCNLARQMKENESVNTEHGIIVMSVLSTHQQISELFQYGSLDLKTIDKATEMLTKTNKEIHPLIQQHLVQRISKALKEKKKQELLNKEEINN